MGSCIEDAAQAMVQALMERQETAGALDAPLSYLIALGMGLLFLGKTDACEAMLAMLEAITHPIGKVKVYHL